MGRSNKEARPHQVVDGGGALNAEKMGDGAAVTVGGPEEGTGMGKAKAKQSGGKAAPAKAPAPAEDTSPGDADAGWDQIGEAGASMVGTYQRNKAAKSSG